MMASFFSIPLLDDYVHTLAVKYTVAHNEQGLSQVGFSQTVRSQENFLSGAVRELLHFYKTGEMNPKQNSDGKTIAEVAGYIGPGRNRHTPTYVGYHIITDLQSLSLDEQISDEESIHVRA